MWCTELTGLISARTPFHPFSVSVMILRGGGSSMYRVHYGLESQCSMSHSEYFHTDGVSVAAHLDRFPVFRPE